MPEDTQQPKWEEQPDGSRVRMINGIRFIDRSTVREEPEPDPNGIAHLVAQQEEGGRVAIIGLDAQCRPVYVTTLYGYL
jgi:hypothetical protein